MSSIIGFTAGVFDMFHIGHLNFIKNAKKNCDYLYVGVNTDDLVLQYKKKLPIISFEERHEIVSAIKYVDETISVNTLDKLYYWNIYKFNVLLVGSDWIGNERWMKTEEVMKSYNAKVVYVPYTEGTSSTILRDKLLNY